MTKTSSPIPIPITAAIQTEALLLHLQLLTLQSLLLRINPMDTCSSWPARPPNPYRYRHRSLPNLNLNPRANPNKTRFQNSAVRMLYHFVRWGRLGPDLRFCLRLWARRRRRSIRFWLCPQRRTSLFLLILDRVLWAGRRGPDRRWSELGKRARSMLCPRVGMGMTIDPNQVVGMRGWGGVVVSQIWELQVVRDRVGIGRVLVDGNCFHSLPFH